MAYQAKKAASSRGFAIISGIFMLLLFAALIALVMRLSTTQNVTAAQDVQGARAYQAARAGVEWGAYRLIVQTACPFNGTMPSLAGLESFTVTVNCAADAPNAVTDAGTTIWRITSTAVLAGSAVGSPGYVERELQVTIER